MYVFLRCVRALFSLDNFVPYSCAVTDCFEMWKVFLSFK